MFSLLSKISISASLIAFLAVVVFCSYRRRKFPTAWAAILLFLECYGLISGLTILSYILFDWPKVMPGDQLWILAVGGLAIFWLSFERLKDEVKIGIPPEGTQEQKTAEL